MCFNSSIVVQFRTLCEEQSVQQLVSMLCVSGGHPSSGVTVESEVAPEGWRAGGLCVLVCVYRTVCQKTEGSKFKVSFSSLKNKEQGTEADKRKVKS